MMRALLAGLVFLTLSGCGNDFERQSQIRRVRVLAVKAQPAELALNPDTLALPVPVQLTALAVAPSGPVTVLYALCAPGNVYAATFECPGKDGVDLPGGRLDLKDPSVQAQLAGGPSTSGPLDLNNPALRGQLEAGIPLFIGYEAKGEGEGAQAVERGIRRVTMRLTATPNQNPELSDLLGPGGEPLGTLSVSSTTELRPVLAEGSVERFFAGGQEKSEDVFFSWHATGEGTVEQFRSQEPGETEATLRVVPTSNYVAPAEPGEVTFHVIARDGRGGTAWLSRTVTVTP